MKSRMVRLVWVVALVVLCGALPAVGQQSQGRLTGTVSDAQGAVLPGVTVTATSPALIGTRTTVTEADGKYLFPALPTGTYVVTFDLSGFKKLTRENIQVVLGQTISADGQMQLGQLTENVTVTGASPIIDVTTTRVGTDLKGEQLIAVPNSSDTWGALAESSGIRMQGFDVGGSHKSQQSGYESFGIENQARVISDGVDHTEGVGGTGFYEDYYANEEVSIGALGSDVEMNSPGASIVSSIKSGGNVFHGLENFAYEPGKFVGSNGNPSDISARGFTCPTDGTGALSCNNPNLLFWEGHADLGGPIAKDKLWFYGAYNQFHIDKQVAGVAQSVATDLGLFQNITTKWTYKMGGANTLVGSYEQGHKQKPQRNLSTLNPPESILAQDSWSRIAKGEWQSVLSNRIFLTAMFGYYRENWPMVPAVDPSVKPPEQFRSNSAVAGAGWNAFSTVRNKPQGKAQMTYYLPDKAGSHDFKFGFEDIYDQYRFGINGQSGPIRYSFASPTSLVPDRIRFADVGAASAYGSGWTASPNLDQHYAGYAQDRWSVNNRVTLTLGVRYDYQNASYQNGNRTPVIHDQLADGTFIFPASTTLTTTSLLKVNNVAPRIGVSYNLTGDGKTVLKGFYGRYYNNLADGFSSANPGGLNTVDYNFYPKSADHLYHGPQDLVNPATGKVELRSRGGGAAAPVDPNAKTPYTDEYSATIERQFWDESSVRFTYVRKHQDNFIPYYNSPQVTAWMNTINVPTTVSYLGVNYNLLDIPASLANSVDSVYTNWPNGWANFDNIEMAFQKRMGATFVSAGWNYQWRNELVSADMAPGDAPNNSTSPLSTDPLGNFPQLTPNPAAPNRQKSTRYGVMLQGRYQFKYDIGASANWRYQSGFNWAPIVADQVTTPAINFSPSPFFTQNINQLRSENVNLLNLRVDKAFVLPGKTKAMFMLDCFNVLNADPVTNFNMQLGSGYKGVIAVLDPRVFQVGVRFEF